MQRCRSHTSFFHFRVILLRVDLLPFHCYPNHWLSLIRIVAHIQHVHSLNERGLKKITKKKTQHEDKDSNLTHVPFFRIST